MVSDMSAGPESNSNSSITNDAHDEPNEQFSNNFGHTKQKLTVDHAMTSNTNHTEKENVVFNYSSVVLTEPMKNVLNRGLNFSILPKTLDTTQVLTEFKKMERVVIWREFFHGNNEEEETERVTPIFKTTKTNMPKNHTTPEGLKMFLNAVKSDLVDPHNRNQENCNLPLDELNALKDLTKKL